MVTVFHLSHSGAEDRSGEVLLEGHPTGSHKGKLLHALWWAQMYFCITFDSAFICANLIIASIKALENCKCAMNWCVKAQWRVLTFFFQQHFYL